MNYYDIVRTVAPAPLLTLDEVKAHLRITGSNDDAYLTVLENAVHELLNGPDGMLGRSVLTQTWQMTIARFPVEPIYIPVPPVQSILSVKYNDTLEAEQTVSAADYELVKRLGRAWLQPAPIAAWPTDLSDRAGAVTVEFVAGYGNVNAVPVPIKAYALLQIGWMFENRESSIKGTIEKANPLATQLLARYKVDEYGVWTA